jgi:hypothetical protein
MISISRDGVEIGEWTEEEVRSLYKDGELIATDCYWKEGMSEWKELGTFIKPPLPFLEKPMPQERFTPIVPPILPIEPKKRTVKLLTVVQRLCSVLIIGAGITLGKSCFQDNSERDARVAASIKQSEANTLKQIIAKEFPVTPQPPPKDYDKVLKGWLADSNKELQDRYARFLTSQNRFWELGANPATVTSVNDIVKRLAALQEALNNNKQAQVFLNNSDAEYIRYLKLINAPDDVMAKSSASFHKYASIDKLTPLLESNRKLMEDYINMYSFLQRTYGSWTIINQQIVFKDSTDYAANAQSVTDYQKEIDDESKTNAVLVSGLSDNTRTLHQDLVELSEEHNKKVPEKIDNDMSTGLATVDPDNTFHYRLTFTGDPKTLLEPSQEYSNIKNKYVDAYRHSDAFQIFRDNKVTIHYEYYDANGSLITEIVVGPSYLN